MKQGFLFVAPYLAGLLSMAFSYADPGVIGWFMWYGGIALIVVAAFARILPKIIPRKIRERTIDVFIIATGYLSIAAIFLIFFFKEGFTAFVDIPLAELFGGKIWQPNSAVPKYGMLPLIGGTLFVTGLTAVISVLIGVGTAAATGIVAAILLAVTRTMGETMAVLLATGNAAQLTANPLASVRTMTGEHGNRNGRGAFRQHPLPRALCDRRRVVHYHVSCEPGRRRGPDPVR